LSKYFGGYYCKDDEAIDGIKNKNDREVLRVISNSYPCGITREEISRRTSIPEDTVYNSVKTLGRIGYIKKEEKATDRTKTTRTSQRSAFTYYIENRSFALNAAEDYAYQFAPGYMQ
jgi:predicted transcriptional regulator